jgi:hypothetical protein
MALRIAMAVASEMESMGMMQPLLGQTIGFVQSSICFPMYEVMTLRHMTKHGAAMCVRYVFVLDVWAPL